MIEHKGVASNSDQGSEKNTEKNTENEADSIHKQLNNTNTESHEFIEYIANLLLKRYGVVFRKVLDREAGLPPWRDLLRVYWRMEARGEIRGGRFVQSVSGEQFALAGAVGSLRKIRNRKKQGSNYIVISAADPLNLQGVLLPGDRIPVSGTHRVAYFDGKAVAVLDKQGIKYFEEMNDTEKMVVRGEIFKR